MELALELRVLEGSLETRDVLPDGVVHKGRAFADPVMELGRNETGLALHEQRILGHVVTTVSGFTEVYREDIDQDHG